jgi:hypothetical protein
MDGEERAGGQRHRQRDAGRSGQPEEQERADEDVPGEVGEMERQRCAVAELLVDGEVEADERAVGRRQAAGAG